MVYSIKVLVVIAHLTTICAASSSLDKANITVLSNIPVDIFVQSDECYKCDLEAVAGNVTEATFKVDTRWKTILEITIANQNLTCRSKQHYLEQGTYRVDVSFNNDQVFCMTTQTNSPPSSFVAIYVAVAVYTVAAILWILFSKKFWPYFWKTESGSSQETEPFIGNENNDSSDRHGGDLENSGGGLISSVGGVLTSSTEVHVSSHARKNVQNPGMSTGKRGTKERLKSLDTFRGISIVIMIFVNYGGGGYWFFSHSKWNGLTVADLVFPWFIFIMGTSMAYSFKSLTRNKTPKLRIFLKIFRRSCTLFLFGLIINTNGCDPVELKKLRIPGVLQRFALTYLVVATMHMFLADKLKNSTIDPERFADLKYYWPEWIFMGLIIFVHTLMTFLLEVPGCSTKRGYLGPGGLEDHGINFDCTGGAGGYIDRQLFGSDLIYHSPTSKEIYKSKVPYDPEGFLGTLNSCFLCFLGLQAGKILSIFKDRFERIKRFCIWGLVLCLLAGILCKFSKNDGWIPVNKNLWSLSFVFCLSGFAFLLLCVCYILIDELKIWNGAPFYFPGMNSILLYMGHELFSNNFPVSWDVPETHGYKLAVNLYGVSFWVAVSTYLYYKGSFYVI